MSHIHYAQGASACGLHDDGKWYVVSPSIVFLKNHFFGDDRFSMLYYVRHCIRMDRIAADIILPGVLVFILLFLPSLLLNVAIYAKRLKWDLLKWWPQKTTLCQAVIKNVFLFLKAVQIKNQIKFYIHSYNVLYNLFVWWRDSS